MKRFVAILVSALLLMCLLSCGYQGTYDDGFEDGYDEGYFDAMIKFEDYYDHGYEDGYWEGSQNGWIDNIVEPGIYLEDEAVHYARQYSEWHPEEAMAIIDSYQTKVPIDGTLPSYYEYLDAIESIVRFYEYFYCQLYR